MIVGTLLYLVRTDVVHKSGARMATAAVVFVAAAYGINVITRRRIGRRVFETGYLG